MWWNRGAFDGAAVREISNLARADHIKALLRSHAEGDDARFYSVAMQIAAQAARSGHGQLATDLRNLIDDAKERRSIIERSGRAAPTPIVKPRGELAGIITVSYPDLRLDDLVLEEAVREQLVGVLLEQRQRERLRHHGFEPAHRLLFAGLPGTGKTMTAGAIAGELSLPLLTVQLDGLITKFMGETAAKLRMVFESMQHTRGVYLFDEFDAIGGDRGVTNDVGEVRRVLNSFLQMVDTLSDDSIVIAATNHPQLLDQALFRRFDLRLEYVLPDRAVAIDVMRRRLAGVNVDAVNWDKVATAANGLSHAEIVRACERAAKSMILGGEARLTTSLLQDALSERQMGGSSRPRRR